MTLVFVTGLGERGEVPELRWSLVLKIAGAETKTRFMMMIVMVMIDEYHDISLRITIYYHHYCCHCY